jgi:hypothetical protein
VPARTLILDTTGVPDPHCLVRRDQAEQDRSGRAGPGDRDPRGPKILPVLALEEWLQAAGISEGPVFRPVALGGRVSAERLRAPSIAEVVKKYARLAGLDATAFAAHSLRSGFLTSAAEGGASVFKMMEISRHRSMDILRGYVRRVDLFKEPRERRSCDPWREQVKTILEAYWLPGLGVLVVALVPLAWLIDHLSDRAEAARRGRRQEPPAPERHTDAP